MKQYKLKDRNVKAYQWNGVFDEHVSRGVPKMEKTFDMELYSEDYPLRCDDCGVLYQDHGYSEYGNHLGVCVCKGDWIIIFQDGRVKVYTNDEFQARYEEA